MTDLYLYGRKVDSVFQLLGEKEDDISYSIGWMLARCPSFLREFLYQSVGFTKDLDDVVIRLQQHETSRGFTDIEIEHPDEFFVIVEAKKGRSEKQKCKGIRDLHSSLRLLMSSNENRVE